MEPVAELVANEAPFGGPGMGSSLAADGDYIVAGDPFDQYPNWTGQGAVYVFRRSGENWIQDARLVGSQACQGCFARSVDISGEVIVVSQPNDTDLFPGYIGRAYAFRRSSGTWVEEQVLLPSISYADDNFSRAIAVHGNIIAVGAPGIDVGDGRVFVFRWDDSQWIEEAILLPSDPPTGRGFGRWVALHGDTIVASAPPDSTPAGQWGSIYVFRYNGASWIQEAKLLPKGPCNSYCLTGPVAIDADVMVGGESGKVAVFRRTLGAWAQETQIIGADTVVSDRFGESLSLHGGSLLVGALDADSGPVAGAAMGSAYLFEFDGVHWVQRSKLSRPRPAALYAGAVAVDSTWAAVSSLSQDANTQTSVFVYCVAYDAPCIPALSTWGAGVLTLLVVVCGAAVLRRRRLLLTYVVILLPSTICLGDDPRLSSPHIESLPIQIAMGAGSS